MSPITQPPQPSTIISDMLDPFTQALTPELTRQLADLKASPEVQARVSVLAEKCNEGELTELEQAEYEAFVRGGNLINIIKAKARKALSKKS